jgi:hypothetical protein
MNTAEKLSPWFFACALHTAAGWMLSPQPYLHLHIPHLARFGWFEGYFFLFL